MKYYLIAGEASGDLHASRLMMALKEEDGNAEFRFFGGDLMEQAGGTCVKHYRELAYMGFLPVLMHLGTILRGIRLCKQDLLAWKPDVVILVDYPGFNLKIARFVKRHMKIPVYYYILPKIWAWKEHRIRNLKRDVDVRYSILPFEVDFYAKHGCEIEYVGNPTLDEVEAYRHAHPESFSSFREAHGLLPELPLVVLAPGSRLAEIKRNLPVMLACKHKWEGLAQFAIAGAPGIDPRFYDHLHPNDEVPTPIFFGETYRLMQQASAALVTSGTATLETALFNVPQVVCYLLPHEKIVAFLRKHFLKVKYVSLVNLILGREAVHEVILSDKKEATTRVIHHYLSAICPSVENPEPEERQGMLDDYRELRYKLGHEGSFARAARSMVRRLKGNAT